MPTTRGRRWVPPSSSGTPQRRSKRPKVDCGVAIRMSHQSASSTPPARHQPSTAAIAGLAGVSRVGPIGPSGWLTSRFIAFRSAPAQKASPPAPVRTRTRASSSASKSASPCRNASAAAASIALRRSGPVDRQHGRRPDPLVAKLVAHRARESMGVGGLVAGVTHGSRRQRPTPGCAPARGSRGQALDDRQPTLGGCGREHGTKKRPGMAPKACLARSLRTLEALCATFKTVSRWLPRACLSQSQDQLSAHPRRASRGGAISIPQSPWKSRSEYPPPMRIDEILAAKRPIFSVEFFPPKTRGGDRAALRDGALAARARARLRLGHLRRRRLDPRRHGRDHPGAEGRARLRDDGPPELRRRDDRGARRRRSTGSPRPGSRTSSPCAATRRAGRRTSSSPRAAWAAPPSWPPSSARALGLHRRRRLLPRGAPRGARPRHRPRLPEDQGRGRRLLPDHPALLRQPGLLRLRRRGAGDGDRRADPRRGHPGRELRPDEADLRALRRLDPAAAWKRPSRPPAATRRPSSSSASPTRRSSAPSCSLAGAPGIHFYALNRAPATRAVLGALRAARPWERRRDDTGDLARSL